MTLEEIPKKIGLFFGSFNPIHLGHLIIGNNIIENTDIEEIWFVVSPQNPLKEKDTLLEDEIRLNLVKTSIKDNNKFNICDVEFYLEKPSYTYNTLKFLKQEHSLYEFVLIIGEDNLMCFELWRDYQRIIDEFKILVYPRANCKTDKFDKEKNVIRIKSPIIEISSTQIREDIRKGKSIQYLVMEDVRKEILKNKYYCNN